MSRSETEKPTCDLCGKYTNEGGDEYPRANVCTGCWKLLDVAKKRDLIWDAKPVQLRLHCPSCGTLHIDEGEFATKPHHTHACQECGNVWRPAIVLTVGVRFLPGFKNEASNAPK